jgi:TonB-linked SusC/RagA family outer membrane protein
MKKIVLILATIFISAQYILCQIKVEGQVKNANGETLPGVNVVIKGTTQGTITDLNGTYILENVPENAKLVFSFVGMVTQEISVAGQNKINVIMTEDFLGLDEIVVIGYGTAKKRDLTGSVASVKNDAIIKAPTANPLEAIQGMVSGVDITRNSGSAGAGATISIRGHRSIGDANNDESYRKLNSPLVIIDGVMGGSITDLNANDIESIEFLKDASSTAIYGYQGANGVIIVTTKKGKEGKPKVSFSSYYGINGLTPYPKGRLGDDYIRLRREAYRTTGQWSSPDDDNKIFLSTELDAIENNQWVDWVDLMLENGTIQNHQLSVSGGNDKSKTYFSVAYFDEVGPVKDEYKRYSARLNTEYTVKKWLKLGLQSQLTYTDQDKRKDAFGKANSASPFGKAYDENGNIIIYPCFADRSFLSPLTDFRPYAAVDNVIGSRIFTNGYIELLPFKGLSFRSNLGTNIEFKREGVFNDAYSMTSASRNNKNEASISNSNSRYLNWDNILTFNKEIGIHSFTITALSSYTYNVSDNSYSGGQDQLLANQLFYNLGGAPSGITISSGYTENKVLSYAARINYSLLGRYLFTFSQRYDGASQLAKDHKWSSFPSAAFAWRISDESFMKSFNSLSNLKLRISYGVTGNANIPPYGTQSTLVSTTKMSYGETPAIAYTFGDQLYQKSVTWERSKTINIGLDLGLFNNRISSVIELYNTNTSGILLNRKMPMSMGGSLVSVNSFSIWQNIGSTNNKGFEITINSLNIKKGDFTWNTTLNFSKNIEKITYLVDNKDVIDKEENSLFLGKPIKSIYTYKKLGIWQFSDSTEMKLYNTKTGKIYTMNYGDIKIQDYNNDTIFNEKDRQYIGSKVPDWIAGLQNTITWNGIDLSIYIFARWGQMINNELLGRYNPSGTGNGPAFIDYWTPENPTNDFPRPKQGAQLSSYFAYQSLNYIDGSFFKIKNFTLGYSLPNNLLSKINVEKMRIYTTVSNLFIFTKSHLLKEYDPENNGSEKAPMSKQIVFGVNVDF